ncbi:hypothetical protein EYF80_033165 [Liparis tanakae]|uniref:Uncharacterized protein n=1 Tax=Liparis tanakae TaxID=230148 RepID=A0A4Z2GSI4_9TELE|nr:hypothetical protein EYF80_033165 [Liparis tanakae]
MKVTEHRVPVGFPRLCARGTWRVTEKHGVLLQIQTAVSTFTTEQGSAPPAAGQRAAALLLITTASPPPSLQRLLLHHHSVSSVTV